jgi:membrane protease YdiL (CAAX protease family)
VRRRARPTLARFLAGLAAGALLWALTRGATTLVLPRVWPGWETHARLAYGWRRGLPISVLLPTLVAIVAAEEAVWRGIATRLCMERFGRWTGVLGGAAIYALAHVATGNPLLVVAAAAMGVVWGWLYAATDDLVAPFVCHVVWDVAVLFVTPLV